MKALWLSDGELSLRDDVPEPDVDSGEVLVRVLRAGICRTDLELIRGYYPYEGILGHEFVGQIVAGDSRRLGQRVVGEINATCGQCSECRSGRSRHCLKRTVLGIVGRQGAFAEYLCLPSENLLKVPDSVSTDAATFTEPLAAALEIREQVSVRPSDRILVVGDGKLGLLIAQTLGLTGSDVCLVGRHPEKLSLVSDRGLRTCKEGEVEERHYDIAVECTGNPSGFEAACKALRPRGTLVLKSTYASQLTLDVAPIVVDELTVIGSRCGPFEPALRLLEERAVDVESLVQERFQLEDGMAAFNKARERGVLKVLLSME